MESYRDVIDAWPSLNDFASDLGVPYVTAQVMRYRGSVHARHWKPMAEAARSRGIKGVSIDLLASIAAKQTAETDGGPRAPNRRRVA